MKRESEQAAELSKGVVVAALAAAVVARKVRVTWLAPMNNSSTNDISNININSSSTSRRSSSSSGGGGSSSSSSQRNHQRNNI